MDWANPIATAWFCFYLAAHIMDQIEDQDDPEGWWAEDGVGFALNVASGLYFSGSLALNQLMNDEKQAKAAKDILNGFYSGMLAMGSGQHRDITKPEQTLDQYWETARSKSGAFFGLACQSGARLVTNDPNRLDAFHQFGIHLGLYIQILDDLEELKRDKSANLISKWAQLRRSLPIIYSLSVLPPDERQQLQYFLKTGREDPYAAEEAFRRMEECGTVLYMRTEMLRHHSKGIESLERASPYPEKRELLASFFTNLVK